MSRSDVGHIKRLATRLGARDSDVIRFAIKLMLGRLAPLQDPSVRGRSLVGVFLESGPELMRHFELDSVRLSSIINDGVEPHRCVDPEDIQLIAMSGLQRSYMKLRVAGVRRTRSGESTQAQHVNGNGGDHDAHGAADGDSLDQSLRRYLYEKYLYASVSGPQIPTGNPDGVNHEP
jgi:hypothetical protein